MRPPHVRTSFRLAAFLTAMTVLACAGGEKAETPDSAATAAAAAPPPAESFSIAAVDGGWSADITPAGITFRQRNDSLVFPAAPYSGSPALREYSSVRTGTDTVRITINMAMSSCSDRAGKTYTHQVQLWLTGGKTLDSKGCGVQK